MAYFKIEEPGHAVKYIKDIDRANGTLEFSESKAGCFQQDSGFFADSELAYLKFHFTEAYPELRYMTIDNDWKQYETLDEEPMPQAAVLQEAPNNPWAVEEAAPQPINQIADAVGIGNPVMEARAAAVEAEWGDEADEVMP
jgi:hypothetical protein